MKELAGKRALVTGASRGIGAAIAVMLADRGADVAITYESSADKAANVVSEIEGRGRKALALERTVRIPKRSGVLSRKPSQASVGSTFLSTMPALLATPTLVRREVSPILMRCST